MFVFQFQHLVPESGVWLPDQHEISPDPHFLAEFETSGVAECLGTIWEGTVTMLWTLLSSFLCLFQPLMKQVISPHEL